MKLFLSFTAALRELSKGNLSAEDLATGLFFFGCARSHALSPWEPVATNHVCDERSWFWPARLETGRQGQCGVTEEGRLQHEELSEALLRAEANGRCAWRKISGAEPTKQMWERLADLLTRNGISLNVSDWSDESTNYPNIAEKLRELGLPLKILY